jgi:hypothetical protein
MTFENLICEKMPTIQLESAQLEDSKFVFKSFKWRAEVTFTEFSKFEPPSQPSFAAYNYWTLGHYKFWITSKPIMDI